MKTYSFKDVNAVLQPDTSLGIERSIMEQKIPDEQIEQAYEAFRRAFDDCIGGVNVSERAGLIAATPYLQYPVPEYDGGFVDEMLDVYHGSFNPRSTGSHGSRPACCRAEVEEAGNKERICPTERYSLSYTDFADKVIATRCDALLASPLTYEQKLAAILDGPGTTEEKVEKIQGLKELERNAS